LDSETIARLVDRWRKQAAQGLGSRRDRMPLLRIETLAASSGDPQLYAEAALEGRSVGDQPVIGLQVARQFVLAGRPAEALQYLSAEDKVPPHCFDEYAETLDRVYEALGRTDDLRELRKRHFLHRPDPERLERYLGGLEAKDRPAAKDLMRRRHETEFYARQASILLGNNACRSGNDRSPTLKVFLALSRGRRGTKRALNSVSRLLLFQ
jgi:hypothetical protein